MVLGQTDMSRWKYTGKYMSQGPYRDLHSAQGPVNSILRHYYGSFLPFSF
jgi:hypothetical protein